MIKGKVKKFNLQKINEKKFPVPQIGWNKIFRTDNVWDSTLLKENNDGDFMYFVHSYYVEPYDNDIILSKTVYGNVEYCSSIKYKNILV